MTQDELRKEFDAWFADVGENMDFWTCYQDAAIKRDAEIVALKAELEAAKKDAERLNHLESEKNSDSTKSLFRQNMPITREAIDAAMQSGK